MIPRARSFRSINRRIISTNSTVSRTSARREGRKREGKRDERWETIPSISGTLIHDDWARANRSNPSVSPKTLFIYLSDPNPFPSLFYFSPLPVSRFLLFSFPGNLYRGQDRGISGPKRAPISLIAVLPEENRVSPKSDDSISISWRSPTDQGTIRHRKEKIITWIAINGALQRLIVDSESLHDGFCWILKRVGFSDRIDFGQWKIKIRQIVSNKWRDDNDGGVRSKRSINLFLGCE